MRARCIAAAGLCIFLLAACHKRAAPIIVTARVPASPPPAVVALEDADRAFSANNYDDACRAYENYLRLAPPNAQHDLALFRLGLAYALRKNPSPDWQRAVTTWKRLLNDYPNSPYKPPAELILVLYSEVGQVNADVKLRDERIKQLSTELDRMKKIDAERRKTP
jgi:tetratricopeptide (TPR) repeat protein